MEATKILFLNNKFKRNDNKFVTMNKFETKCDNTYRGQWLDGVVVLPSPASIWDYPQMDQLACIMSSVYEAATESKRGYFPPAKSRVPPAHMESPARFEPRKTGVAGFNQRETELGEINIIVPSSDRTTSTGIMTSSGVVPCGSGGCKISRRNHEEPRPESPWHTLKTIFLVTVIVALIVWVIVYTLLAQYEIL